MIQKNWVSFCLLIRSLIRQNILSFTMYNFTKMLLLYWPVIVTSSVEFKHYNQVYVPVLLALLPVGVARSSFILKTFWYSQKRKIIFEYLNFLTEYRQISIKLISVSEYLENLCFSGKIYIETKKIVACAWFCKDMCRCTEKIKFLHNMDMSWQILIRVV